MMLPLLHLWLTPFAFCGEMKDESLIAVGREPRGGTDSATLTGNGFLSPSQLLISALESRREIHAVQRYCTPNVIFNGILFREEEGFNPDGTLQSRDGRLIEWRDGSAPTLLCSSGCWVAVRQLNREY